MKIIEGDILKADVELICQQVDCECNMVSSIGKRIKKKFPVVYKKYMDMFKLYDRDNLLGKYQIIDIQTSKNPLYCVNMFTQKECGSDECFTNHDIFQSTFNDLCNIVSNNDIFIEKTIAIPYKLGYYMGDENWNEVSNIIDAINDKYNNIDIIVYKLEV
jgi:O-acetyl-ADP-ribose deacetylase (regulator of RNase III)